MKKKLFLIICLLGALDMSLASNLIINDGVTIRASYENGNDRSSSISASIDGHYLTVIFTENLGQVAIDVSLVDGGEIETTTTYTPSGVIIYIPVNCK